MAEIEVFEVFTESEEKIPIFKPRIRIRDKAEIKMLKKNPVGKLEPSLDLKNYYYK